MADICFVLHWTLRDFDGMPLSDLIRWHEKALERWRQTIQLHGYKPL